MAKRGRPPHPDILTPREWQVLDLLRQNLTNEQIAHRLDISPATAKYHVSEILSKLGVETREEAAVWQPEAAVRWWQRALVWLAGVLRSLRNLTIAKAISLGIATALLVGVLLLVWAASGSDESSREGDTGITVQLPESLLTTDQVLVHASRGTQTPVEEAQVTLTTYAAAIEEIADRGYGTVSSLEDDKVPGDSPTWLVFLSTHDRGVRSSSDSPSPVTVAPESCRQTIVVLPDALSIPKPRFIIQSSDRQPCPSEAIQPRDRAILAAASRGYVSGVLRDTTVSEIRAEEIDTPAAAASIRGAGGVISVPDSGPYRSIEELEQHVRGPVWLITLSGLLYDSTTPVAAGQTPACRQFSAIVTTAGWAVLSALIPSSACT